MELTDIQKGYIAGLIDGEAYIGISRTPGKHAPRLCIGMTDYDVLKWMQDTVGGSLNPKYRNFPTDAPCWSYVMSPNTMREVLPIIAPYLKVKQRQVYLMLTYFSYFKKDDRDSSKGLKSVIKDKFHVLFKQMNSRGNRKRGEFKEYLSEATLSQALGEIQEKVHRLRSDVKDIKKEKIINTLKTSDKKITRSNLCKKHYFIPQNSYVEFDSIMDELVASGIVKRVSSKFHDSCSYIYASNDHTSAPPERDDIVRAAQRCADVLDKEPVR